MKTLVGFAVIVIILAALALPPAAAEDQIKIGSLHEFTGTLSVYGIPMSQALRLAVDSINTQGGLLGKKIEIIEYDTQSEVSKCVEYANTLIRKDKVRVVFGAVDSRSREALRPVMRREKIPYFYSSLYAGGTCDRYVFVTGPTASQQFSVLMEWAAENYGKRFYIMASDYSFGTLSGHWIHHYVERLGGEVVGEEFLPVSTSDFGPTLNKIRTTKADVVVALPLGTRQNGFYEQFAASELKEKVGIVSNNYGSCNQQFEISPVAGEGIVASLEYVMWIDTPRNKLFKKLWESKYGLEKPIISGAANTWNAVHLWAAAVEKAGTVESEAVINALESGISFEGPNGTVRMLPGSHHLQQNILIVRGDRRRGFDVVEVFDAVIPDFENEMCDLRKDPSISRQFVPEF